LAKAYKKQQSLDYIRELPAGADELFEPLEE